MSRRRDIAAAEAVVAATRQIVAELQRLTELLERMAAGNAAARFQGPGGGRALASGAITTVLGALAYGLASEAHEFVDEEFPSNAARR